VALPAISCGVSGYPIADAARIAIDVARERTWALGEIRFVLVSGPVLAAWQSALAR
jgi:O-acetyl-ADP-ribose deacetylase (regulator of RNase III)